MAQVSGSYSGPMSAKRRLTGARRKHGVQHMQRQPSHLEPASQDEAFVQGQLLRSISTALVMVGFDSVKPSALEAFRAQTEEYMLHFLSAVSDSMAAARRVHPTPNDFTKALAASNITPTSLTPHTNLDIPSAICNPPIAAPAPAEADAPNLAPMLGGALALTRHQTHNYIPAHFPQLPSRHAWQSTPVFTEREKDPRKIRERATQEGVLAEQALRKLTAANKPPRSLGSGLESAGEKRKQLLWQETLTDLLGDSATGADGDVQLRGPGDEETRLADMLKSGGGMRVNHDRGHWRKGAPAGSIRT